MDERILTSCRVCGQEMHDLFIAKILDKYRVRYYVCQSCGLIQTEIPYWLDEAYSNPISAADTGLVQRNITIAEKLAVLLFFGVKPRGTYVDIAGGYGMLTRLMRDYGFAYFWNDVHCTNMLAKGFEADESIGEVDGISGFEVLEHVHDPLLFLRDYIDKYNPQIIVFTTELYENVPPSKDWWYYAFKTGQHISFFKYKTLESIGKRLGFRFITIDGLHILSRNELKRARYLPLLMKRPIRLVAASYVQKKLGSKIMPDHQKMIASD